MIVSHQDLLFVKLNMRNGQNRRIDANIYTFICRLYIFLLPLHCPFCGEDCEKLSAIRVYELRSRLKTTAK